MTQRGFDGGFDHRFAQQRFQFADQRKVGAALHQKLDHAGILAGGTIQLFRQTLVFNHGGKDDVRQLAGLFLMQLF